MDTPTFSEQVMTLLKEYDNNCNNIPRDLPSASYLLAWQMVREDTVDKIEDLARKEVE